MKPKRLLALGVLLVGVTAAASLTGAQKSAPQPTEQQKLKERVDALESQLKEAQAKADRAAMEKDYIERIQKDSKDYYDKVLATQTWTLTIVGLFLTAVFGLTARFGFGIFDRRIQDSLRDASMQLRTEFNQRLDERFQQLEKANADRAKELENALRKRIDQTTEDMTTKNEFSFRFVQGLAAGADERYADARVQFRKAARTYKLVKSTGLLEKEAAARAVRNIFVTLLNEHKDRFDEHASKELQDELYNDLEDELAGAALEFPRLAPLLRKRKDPATQASETATTEAATEAASPPAPPTAEKT